MDELSNLDAITNTSWLQDVNVSAHTTQALNPTGRPVRLLHLWEKNEVKLLLVCSNCGSARFWKCTKNVQNAHRDGTLVTGVWFADPQHPGTSVAGVHGSDARRRRLHADGGELDVRRRLRPGRRAPAGALPLQ